MFPLFAAAPVAIEAFTAGATLGATLFRAARGRE